MEELKIDHNVKESRLVGLKKNSRYEEVGEIRYRQLAEDNLELYWTEIKEDLRGKGYGTELVKQVLEYAIERRISVKPSCSFINDFLMRHGEYGKTISGKRKS